jgi:hypothetical protein
MELSASQRGANSTIAAMTGAIRNRPTTNPAMIIGNEKPAFGKAHAICGNDILKYLARAFGVSVHRLKSIAPAICPSLKYVTL